MFTCSEGMLGRTVPEVRRFYTAFQCRTTVYEIRGCRNGFGLGSYANVLAASHDEPLFHRGSLPIMPPSAIADQKEKYILCF